MADLVEIKAKIVRAKDDLAQAVKDKDRDKILMCGKNLTELGNNLTELRRKKNNLETRAGKSIFSFHFCFDNSLILIVWVFLMKFYFV